MRNVYHNLNLQLSRLIALYLIVFVGYIYVPETFVSLRHIMSMSLLLLLGVTILGALLSLFPKQDKDLISRKVEKHAQTGKR